MTSFAMMPTPLMLPRYPRSLSKLQAFLFLHINIIYLILYNKAMHISGGSASKFPTAMPEFVSRTQAEVSLGQNAVKYPESKEEADFLERLLVSEISQLSIEQKEKILFDIHGIAPSVEDPPSVEEIIKDLRELLKWARKKEAYELALKQRPDYVNSREFLLFVFPSYFVF